MRNGAAQVRTMTRQAQVHAMTRQVPVLTCHAAEGCCGCVLPYPFAAPTQLTATQCYLHQAVYSTLKSLSQGPT